MILFGLHRNYIRDKAHIPVNVLKFSSLGYINLVCHVIKLCEAKMAFNLVIM